jgi:hypothetical protein
LRLKRLPLARCFAMFCEWGSGLGVVTCLAALLEFDANGIEVDSTLAHASRLLAADFDVPVEFAQGNFIPAGATRPRPRRRFAALDGSSGEL